MQTAETVPGVEVRLSKDFETKIYRSSGSMLRVMILQGILLLCNLKCSMTENNMQVARSV